MENNQKSDLPLDLSNQSFYMAEAEILLLMRQIIDH